MGNARSQAKIGPDIRRSFEAVRIANDCIEGQGAKWPNSRYFHQTAANFNFACSLAKFPIDPLLIVDQLLAIVDQASQLAYQLVLGSPENLPDFELNIRAKIHQVAAFETSAKDLKLAPEEGYERKPLPDEMTSNCQARLQRLAFETLEINPRDSSSAEATCVSDPLCIPCVGLVPSQPKKFAQLPSFIKIDFVATIAEPAREGAAYSSFKADPLVPTAAKT